MKAILYSLSFAFLFALSPGSVSAQTPCGSIIGSDALPSDHISILDCNNPFGVTSDPSNPYTVRINGQDIEPGATVALPEGRAYSVSHSGTPHYSRLDTEIFKHVGNNYERVNLTASEPTPGDYEEFAQTYFGTEAERTRYIEIVIYNFEHTNLDDFFYDSVSGDALIDETTGETVESRYYDYIEAFEDGYVAEVPTLGAGTYTMLFYESQPILVGRSLLESIRDFFIPTAYAQCAECFPPHIYTITFTITEAPAGASSILFLPGIMGSRLYETGDVCGENKEHELWFSRNDCEQLRMMTDFIGTSVNTVYTRPGEEAIVDSVAGVSPLYSDWLETLREWKEAELISEYRAVPYDWRLSLGDVLKTKEVSGKIIYDSTASYRDSYIYKSLEQLVATSDSGSVSVVTHSNGGLVAKALLNEMKANNDPLLDDIDKLMLIAVPQTGTPDAITSILHGSELGFGLISDKKTSRALTNTAPFAHHLLPSESYINGVGATVSSSLIDFIPGASTDPWRNQYGGEVNTIAELHSFLSNTSGRTKPAFEDVLTPEVVDPYLLNYANTVHVEIDNFAPPSTMNIIQVGGTGAPTKESITYFTDSECVSRAFFFFKCTEYKHKLGYRINNTDHGDGTVVLPSALSMAEAENVERVWIDLDKYNISNIDRVHRNILEIPQLQDFIGATMTGESYTNNEYVTTEQISAIAQDRLVYQLHSPLDMVLISDDGEVSSSTNTISNAVYERVGELQYISIPAETRNPRLKLFGYETGSFTLDVEEWNEDSLSKRITFSAIPTSTSTIVSLVQNSLLASSTLLLDLEGDGLIEATATTIAVFPYQEEETIKQTKNNGGTRVDRHPTGVVAGVSTSSQTYVEQLRIIINLLNRVLLLLQTKYD